MQSRILCWIQSRSVLCLRLVSLHVPSKVIVGDVIKLTCRYDLEGDTLYSIKWYRDDVEFFRTQIRPVLIYASETWTITKLEENRIVSFEEKILRSVLEGLEVTKNYVNFSKVLVQVLWRSFAVYKKLFN
ncbi:UNVERIFIED_CONTAM: hypothetical protein NCL1_10749 [Trichonephila clavipes]